MNTLLFKKIFVFHITYILQYEVVLFFNAWCNHSYIVLLILLKEINVTPFGVKTILIKFALQ